MVTVGLSSAICVACLLLHLLLNQSPWLSRVLYSPRRQRLAAGRRAGSVEGPFSESQPTAGAALAEDPTPPWSQLIREAWCGHEIAARGGSLELRMLLRYLRMNLTLFAVFTVVALPLLLTLNGLSPGDVDGPDVQWKYAPPLPPPSPMPFPPDPPSSPPPHAPPGTPPFPPRSPSPSFAPAPAFPPPDPCHHRHYGVLETLSLSHVRPRHASPSHRCSTRALPRMEAVAFRTQP
eukprot:5750940-Pleurochrysis_carterae.AAC.1